MSVRAVRYSSMVLISCLLLTVGCLPTRTSNSNTSEYRVEPKRANYNIQMTARDIVGILQAAGFSNQEIYELGPDLRTALMNGGAAQIVSPQGRDKVLIEAAIVIRENDYVHISRRGMGFLIYDARNHCFGIRENQQSPPTHLGPMPLR